ncbi:Mitochondrial inner membrane protein OXA1L [Smittium mucronatum]|uniref:Mitochondrial inner membrane protein OXA1L n=1 Tax=Smittium mucronatum TaxID=133383 RepID=A0A1R0H7K9_9FUNG|nr:Mitochondrial inner membrane protein OXA1L [Smittium mucronatum]
MSALINLSFKSHSKIASRFSVIQLKSNSFSALPQKFAFSSISSSKPDLFNTKNQAKFFRKHPSFFNNSFNLSKNFSTSQKTLTSAATTGAAIQPSDHVDSLTSSISDSALDSSLSIADSVSQSASLHGIVSDVLQIGDLKAAGLAANTPVGWVEQLLEFSHVYTGLPWWGTIITATLAIRLALFPINVVLQRKIINMQNVQPELVAIKAKLTRAQEEKNMYEYQRQATLMRSLMKKRGVNPFSTILLPVIQMPIMISFFMALRAMSELPVPSFETGGALWFTNLALADPYFILPVISSLGMIGLFEISKKLQNSIPSPAIMTWGMRGVGVIMALVTMKFQAAIFVYFITSNLFSTALVFVFANPYLRKLFKIPQLKKVNLAITPKNAFVKAIESNLKMIKK